MSQGSPCCVFCNTFLLSTILREAVCAATAFLSATTRQLLHTLYCFIALISYHILYQLQHTRYIYGRIVLFLFSITYKRHSAVTLIGTLVCLLIQLSPTHAIIQSASTREHTTYRYKVSSVSVNVHIKQLNRKV